ncbi:MAG: ribosomal protein [Pseudomonadota bacterium]|jgi:large subunit ribosomal protein L17
MRHGFSKRTLNMNAAHRVAVLRNLSISLIRHGKVETTLAKAKELKSFVEPIITIAKKGKDFNQIRLIKSKLGSHFSHSEIYAIVDKFTNRDGGYTRLVKNGNRYGDAAPKAVVEFVD